MKSKTLFKFKKPKKGSYTWHVYFKGKLISKRGYVHEDEKGTDDTLTFDVEELLKVNIKEFPNNFTLRLEYGLLKYKIFKQFSFSRMNDVINVELCGSPRNENLKWNSNSFFSKMKKIAEKSKNIAVELEEEDDFVSINYSYAEGGTIRDAYSRCIEDFKSLYRKTELIFNGFKWKKSYETNELLFTKEILIPLFRKMEFLGVRYNGGGGEHGKDILFYEIDKFGQTRYYGVQAKDGDVRGGVKSDINDLETQIRNAFKMPFHTMDSKSTKYISSFIIAISGKFTKNAQDEIIEAMNKDIRGSVYFFDKEKILELIEKYWY